MMSDDFHLEGQDDQPINSEQNVQALAKWLRDLIEGTPPGGTQNE